MKYRSLSLRLIAPLLVILAGCGGASSGPGPSQDATPVTLDVNWGARSREIKAPSSALSAVITIPGAKVGGDFVWTINRDTTPAAYNKKYVSSSSAQVGQYTVSIKFYSQADGAGSVVGTASAAEAISPNLSLGYFSTIETVASVAVVPDQIVWIGQAQDIAFTAKDSSGTLLAITPGSVSVQIVNGADKLKVNPNGQATGLAFGPATLTVSVDGKTSPPASVLAAQKYAVTDLGVLPEYSESSASAISNKDQVSGTCYKGQFNSVYRGFLWQAGNLTDIGVLPGDVNSGCRAHRSASPHSKNGLRQFVETTNSG